MPTRMPAHRASALSAPFLRRAGRGNLTVHGAAALVAVALSVASSLPATAGSDVEALPSTPLQVQSVVMTEQQQDESATLSRDRWGVTHFSVVGWPVPEGSTISSTFGPRNAPCFGCSSMHEGVDFTPGAGTPISSIAKGVVREVGSAGALGVHAYIEHVVDGEKVTSMYAHMQYGSLTVSAGDTVKKGQRIGAVGNTGASTGAHLHFSILNGSQHTDPLRWLRSHVTD